MTVIEKIIFVCNNIILYCFYGLFFLVPLTFSSSTHELFEFNKMWLTIGLAIVITGAWLTKMALRGTFAIQKTPLDIPILLFLLSQVISTIFSLDLHISLWGYYTRFNGGLVSTITYILLYYALISNYRELDNITGLKISKNLKLLTPLSYSLSLLTLIIGFFIASKTIPGIFVLFVLISFLQITITATGTLVKRLLGLGLFSGAIVALWGLPSHFGYDPTCLLLRGTFDVSCWTDAFQPKVRIFSTFGQPNWLGAYLAIMLSLTTSFVLSIKYKVLCIKLNSFSLPSTFYLLLSTLFYLSLIFTGSQSGFGGFVIAFGLFFILLVAKPLYESRKTLPLKNLLEQPYAKITIWLSLVFVLLAFLVGVPIRTLERFTLPSIASSISQLATSKQGVISQKPEANLGELGGTDSGTIRKIVWEGTLRAWQKNPIFGTGVETFAFAYYANRPVSHNLTSEWDFLYNKAHNEYLNFLATTGIFGLGSYLLMIGTFIFLSIKQISKSEFLISKQIPNSKPQLDQLEIRSIRNLPLGLLAAYISILVSNFVGFSVVVINIYFFLIPAFVFISLDFINPQKTYAWNISNKQKVIRILKWASTGLILLTTCYLLLTAVRFWYADTFFSKGYNFNKSGSYQLAYPQLQKAITLRPEEPIFQDEYAYNIAVLSVALFDAKETTAAAQLAKNSEELSDYIVASHPNNVTFWKTRVRILYALSQIDQLYLKKALTAIQQAQMLAPTDAKVSYNLGILQGQNGETANAVATLEETVAMKKDYQDAWYALALYYHELATDEKAISIMRYIVKNFGDQEVVTQAKDTLKAWGFTDPPQQK